jgi:cytohesin
MPNSGDVLYDELNNKSSEYIEQWIKQAVDNVNITPHAHGATILHHTAMRNGLGKVAKIIISMGGNVNLKEVNGYTPLHIAASYGSIDVAEVLISNGADIDSKDLDGYTPLHAAADRNVSGGNDIAIAKILISHGADINTKNNRGATPLDLAVKISKIKMISLLSGESN